MKDLITRLRRQAKCFDAEYNGADDDLWDEEAKLCREAADAIEALAAECAALKRTDIIDLLQANAELRAAIAQEPIKITPKQAIDALSEAMKEDYGYAWAWHCNLAMMAYDAGAPRAEANERAADLMHGVFGVDTHYPPAEGIDGDDTADVPPAPQGEQG